MLRLKSLLICFAYLFSVNVLASETVKGAKKDYEKFKVEMSARLDSVEKEITEMKEKTKDKSSAARDQALAELEKTREELKTQLNEAKESSGQTWKKFKKSFASSVEKLNSKIQKAAKD